MSDTADKTISTRHTAQVIRLGDVDSTNSEAKRRAADGAPSGTWIIAERQTQGRGRRARAWVSEPGNLYSSLLLRLGAEQLPGDFAFVAGLALHSAVLAIVPELASCLRLKWPNDLVVPDGKLSGILLEYEQNSQGNGGLLMIGIGVNCMHHPEATEHPASDLAALGYPVAPHVLFDALTQAFAHWQCVLATHGLPAIREAWLERARGIGAPILVRLESKTLHGRFGGLDHACRLVLERDGDAPMIISAGDVFFPDADQPGDSE